MAPKTVFSGNKKNLNLLARGFFRPRTQLSGRAHDFPAAHYFSGRALFFRPRTRLSGRIWHFLAACCFSGRDCNIRPCAGEQKTTFLSRPCRPAFLFVVFQLVVPVLFICCISLDETVLFCSIFHAIFARGFFARFFFFAQFFLLCAVYFSLLRPRVDKVKTVCKFSAGRFTNPVGFGIIAL